jgi:hypothetical protein
VVAAAERQAKASEVQAQAIRELVKRLPPEAQ